MIDVAHRRDGFKPRRKPLIANNGYKIGCAIAALDVRGISAATDRIKLRLRFGGRHFGAIADEKSVGWWGVAISDVRHEPGAIQRGTRLWHELRAVQNGYSFLQYTHLSISLKKSVVLSCINPHGFSLSCSFKSAFAVKVEGSSIGHNHMLVEPFVTRHKPLHEF